MIPGTDSPKNTTWNGIIRDFPNSHVLQTSQWAELKTQFGWIPQYLVWEEAPSGRGMRILQESDIKVGNLTAAGLLLEREAFPGLRVHYLPKGPLLKDWSNLPLWERVLEDLAEYAHQRGALQIKIDPDVEVGSGVPGEEDFKAFDVGEEVQQLLTRKGWVFSQEQVQFKNTILVDLQEDEDQLLARMKSKTRYNIRLAGRKGIEIRYGGLSDLPDLYRMYAETSHRAGFAIRGESYYISLWKLFMDEEGKNEGDPVVQPIIAEFEGQMIAGAMIFRFGNRSWYLHGMSVLDHSDKMAPHLIQWEAMRWAKGQGCTTYDMWGAPDQFEPADSLWGIYRFKRGFGGQTSLTIGAWDYPVKPLSYGLYTRWLPRLLDVMRWIGRRRTTRITRAD
jgi:lipid II:glycine glycyltransferase (peptidoglycan interpeptide bridge formation enzyme)